MIFDLKSNKAKYIKLLKEIKSYDLHFDYNYLMITEGIYINHNGESHANPVFFSYQQNDQKFILPFYIIKTKLSNGEVIVDGETPYGYPGALSNSTNNSFLERALEKLKSDLVQAGLLNFLVRNNPLLNTEIFIKTKKVSTGQVVLADLHKSDVPEDIVSNSALRNIKKAIRNNLQVKILNTEQVDQSIVNEFYDLYIKTMERNDAKDFYFFKYEYIRDLIYYKNSLLFAVYLDNNPIAFMLHLEDQNILYYHLGASDTKHFDLRPNDYLYYQTIKYSLNNNNQYICWGGGATSKKDDGLLRFKKKFGNLMKDNYINKIVINEEKYDSLKKEYDYNGSLLQFYKFD